eukprot:scaffold3023_cov68-Skeletonema_marinoi.AAC.1
MEKMVEDYMKYSRTVCIKDVVGVDIQSVCTSIANEETDGLDRKVIDEMKIELHNHALNY